MIKAGLWDKLANITMSNNPYIDPQDFIDTVTKNFNKELSKMSYQVPKSKVGGPTDSGETTSSSKDNGSGNKPSHRFNDLPADLQDVAKNFIATGAFDNYDDIIRQWEDIGTLPKK